MTLVVACTGTEADERTFAVLKAMTR